MTAEPNEPHAWVILGGLRDLIHPPYALHDTAEFPAILETWKASRISHWPQDQGDRHFSFGWCKTRVSLSDSESAIEGFVLYGTTPFDMQTSTSELCTLAGLIATKFGQSAIELHVCGQRLTFQRQEGNQTSN